MLQRELYYLRSGGSEGRGVKSNQSKKRKGKKRDSIRSRDSRKIDQKIR
ncbi:MAG: hypothetical protein ACMUEL_08440 [Flavobacteriales bacterium Tduv]